jgi:hypothetical protein
MKVGIVSDTHGKTKRLAAALEMLRQRGCEAVVHCGDVGSAECIEQLGRCGVGAYVVAGNMDKARVGLRAAARAAGVTFSPVTVEVALGDGEHLIATHGDRPRLTAELVAGQQFPYVCHGHTHRIRDERIGKVRVINPGALLGPRGARGPTLAVLDTDADTVEFLDVP